MSQMASDKALLSRIADGDHEAVRVLYGRYHVRLYRFILRLVRNDAVAEELVADVFLEVWRHAGRFAGRSAAATWLYTIARNKAISHLRRKSEGALDEEAVQNIADTADTPEVTLQKETKAEVMRKCLEKLSPEHREIIDLVYYHEMSVKEASEILGIPPNTVKTRMFYARKRLSEILKAAGIDRGWP